MKHESLPVFILPLTSHPARGVMQCRSSSLWNQCYAWKATPSSPVALGFTWLSRVDAPHPISGSLARRGEKCALESADRLLDPLQRNGQRQANVAGASK